MTRRITLAVAAVGLATASLTGWASAGIEGSKHDFSNAEWSGGDHCAACHATKNPVPPRTPPAWNPNADLTRRFGAPAEKRPSPGSGTRICLRCHDGSIARDTIAGVVRVRFANVQNPGLLRSGHGRSNHPVGVRYPQFDKGFRPMTTVLARNTVRLPDGRVECVSCHDPHNQSGMRAMLVTGNARSALCLTCHKK
ncbi:MAG: cytochrome c3 family protein [Phycisphaerae bacterium]